MLTERDKTDAVEQDKRLRVLISAYSCGPGLPSEPGVGWNNVVQASRFHDVWVVTSEGNRPRIEAELAQNPMPNVTWIWVSLPKWIAWRLGGETGGRVHYYLYQIAAYQAAKQYEIDHQITFDIVHHVSYVSYWTPIFLSRLSGKFVWGPVGGAESAPGSFYQTLNFKGMIYERVRDAVRWAAHHLDPFVRETAQNAAIAFATTRETEEKMRELKAQRIEILPETGLPAEDIDTLIHLPPRTEQKPFRFISIGRFLGWKGYHLGLQAFARFHEKNPDSEYWLLGRGPQMGALQDLAQSLGLASAVTFTGFVTRDEVIQRLSNSNVLIHPSLHDSGGWTCLEGMAAGKPVLCLDLGGPATQVNEETGLIVPAETPEQSIDALAEAMAQLAHNPERCAAMGRAGRQRIQDHFDWNKRGEYLAQVYAQLVKQVAT